MISPAYAVLETAIVILFLVACFHAWRRGPLLEVVSAAFYGLLLEEGDILLFKTYQYSSEFVLRIDRVPVSIALAWAIIIYTCMHFTDTFGITRRVAPFADAVWAIMLDLAFDAVAIRLGFWTWVIPLDKGFFGVPAGNFYAWLFVAFSFSLFTRIARHLRMVRTDLGVGSRLQMAVPFLAYFSLLLGMVPFFILKDSFFPQTGGGLEIFWAVLALFVGVVAAGVFRGRERSSLRFDWVPVLLRSSFHVYFLAALLLTGIFASLPVLLAISLGMLALEVGLVLLLWKLSRYPEEVAEAVANEITL